MAKTSTISYSPVREKQPPIVKTKRAAIYIRCSSDEAKKEGYSPEIQEEKIRSFIKRQDWKLNDKYIYRDIGYSGGTKNRPGLKKLLEDAKNKEFDIVLVFRLDRFFRRLKMLEEVLDDLTELEVGVKSMSEEWADYSNPSSRLNLQVLGAVAEWQRGVTLVSRNEGMIKAMKQGKYLSGTPYYGVKFNRKTQKVEEYKKESSVIKMMYNWVTSDKLSRYKIQEKMNALKIPTKYDNLGRRKKTESKCWWNIRTVARILNDERYTGVFYYRKYKYPARIRNQNNLRPKNEWIKISVPQIISKELFEKTQKQLKKNKALSPRNTRESYILQKKIVCGIDGYRYQCATRHYHSKNGEHRKTKYYFCNGIRDYSSPKQCLSPTISESRIIPPVWNKLKEILINPKIIMQELEGYLDQKNKKTKIQKEIDCIESTMKSFQTKRERYAEIYAEGSISKEFYDKKIGKCDKDTEKLQKEAEKLSQFLLVEEEKERRIRSVQNLYGQLKESLENATYEMKREILQRLVEKVIKTGNSLDIEFNLPLIEKSSLELASGVSGDTRRMD